MKAINVASYLNSIKTILKETDTEAVKRVMDFMHESLSGYDWVGIYVMQHNSKLLHLGPFAGAPTDHTRIPFGKGICGQVAASGTTYTANDVHAETNYIACSITTKSEIVVPIYHENILIAQLDIDSHKLANFDDIDEAFLKAVAILLAPYIFPNYKTLNLA